MLHKSPLKWLGGKGKQVDMLRKLLLAGNSRTLVECCTGAGNVFLNVEFEQYLLMDSNRDLINFYLQVQGQADQYIRVAKEFFDTHANEEKTYYHVRDKIFNPGQYGMLRAVCFLWLNKHSYNSVTRYNLSGKYNTPYGSMRSIYFPEEELRHLAKVSKRATFKHGDFREAFVNAPEYSIIYADPPFSPASKTANFTTYDGKRFTQEDHADMVEAAIGAATRGITTFISNNDVAFTRGLYKSANRRHTVMASRSVSCKGQARRKKREVIAVYKGEVLPLVEKAS